MDEKRYYVYSHTRPDTNNIFYIGIGFGHRSHSKSGRNIYWKRIVNKNNGEYLISIIKDKITRPEACELEKYYISLYGRKDINNGLLCNMSDGGEVNNGLKFSPERLAKAKLRTKERHNMFGIPRPQHVKEKISITKKGIPMKEEHKIKISDSLKCKYKNIQHPSKGIKQSKETIEKRQSSIKKRTVKDGRKPTANVGSKHAQCIGSVLQYCKNTGYLINTFESTGHAERVTGIHSGRISAVINGKRGHSKGFIFKRTAT